MTKRENFFKLIKSLTRSEKRYFKLYASANLKNPNYLRLFDEIEMQQVYDERKIRSKFTGENFLLQLHVTKNYLSKLILKSLRIYHSRISKDTELMIMIRNIELLYKKELYDICAYEIQKAEKLAEKYEKLALLLQILSWKRKLVLVRGGSFMNNTELLKILSKEQYILQKRARLNEYWFLTSEVSQIIQGKSDWNKILSSELMTKIDNADSLQSKILYYHLNYSCFISNNKPKEASQALSRLIKLLESNPHRIKDDPSSYITALNNRIGYLLSLKKYDEIPEMLEKIKQVPSKYKIKAQSALTLKLLIRTYNVEIEMLRDTKQWDKASEKANEVARFLEKEKENVPDIYMMLFYYQFAYISFRKKHYNQSLKWTNEILGRKFGESREDILSYTRFLNLILHYELNNVYVLRYAVESTRRFLKKKRELHNFEKVLLNFFSKASTSLKEKHRYYVLRLKNDLFAKTDIRQKENILDYLDFETWIDETLSK